MGTTVMLPVLTRASVESPYSAAPGEDDLSATLFRREEELGSISFPPQPKFYELETADGVPYWKIAQLHAGDVLATTVLQTCVRYGDKESRCQFCAIGESLKGGRTIASKSPEQLAEVAAAAKELDGVSHVVMTTGTPPTGDRGADILSQCAKAIKERTGLPIQAQCEPPDDFVWFHRMKAAGVDSLGIHLETWDQAVRAEMMPSKAEVPLEYYLEAYAAAVEVFGWGQVSTYLIAGLGETAETMIEGCRHLIGLGVYPFVVPLVPITGTRLEGYPAPTALYMRSILKPVGAMLVEAGMTSDLIKAGCGKCGACSPLSAFEV